MGDVPKKQPGQERGPYWAHGTYVNNGQALPAIELLCARGHKIQLPVTAADAEGKLGPCFRCPRKDCALYAPDKPNQLLDYAGS